MSDTDKIYRNLQIHLDKETFGFPAAKNGSDIKLLKPFQFNIIGILNI